MTAAFSPQVDIEYRLFYGNAQDQLFPVESEEDLQLEAAIRAADPWRRVDLKSDPGSQSVVLHQHVVQMLYDFAFKTDHVDLANGIDDVFDPATRTWRDIRLGASRVYPILRTKSATNLSIAVWTAGAEADGPVVAPV